MGPEEVKAAVLAAFDRPAKSIAEAGGKADQGAETPAIETSSPDNQPDELAEENGSGGSPGSSSPTATVMDEASTRREPPVGTPAAARAATTEEDMPDIPDFLRRGPDNSLPDLSREPPISTADSVDDIHC